MRQSKAMLIWICAGVVAVLGSVVVRADDRIKDHNASGSGYSVYIKGSSMHGGEHATGVSNGRSRVFGEGDAPEGHKWRITRRSGPGGTITLDMWVLDKPTKVRHKTPFCGIISATSMKGTFNGTFPETSATGWDSVAAETEKWGNVWVKAAKSKLRGWCGPCQMSSYVEKESAHLRENPPAEIITLANLPEGLTTATAVVKDFRIGGLLSRTIDPTTGETIIAEDGNGDWIYEEPQTLSVRFTSSVSSLGGTAVRYTYQLENLDGETRTFALDELKTAEHPSGWSGTLEGTDVETLVVDVASEDVWLERAQATFAIVGGDNDEAEHAAPVQVYVSTSRRDYTGSALITSAVHETSPFSRNRVTIQFDGEAPTAAMLIRESAGETVVIEELEAPISLGTPIVIYDDDPEPTSEYVVVSGHAANGYASGSVAVVY